jgi:predicted Zn-dependent peptidase
LQKIKKNLVGPEELARAKEQIKGNLLLSLESTCNRMSRIAKSEMFNDELLTPEESVARIEAVTADDILEIADELFDESKLITTAIGPFETES